MGGGGDCEKWDDGIQKLFGNSANEGMLWVKPFMRQISLHFLARSVHSGNSQWDTQEIELKDLWQYSVGEPLIIPIQSEHSGNRTDLLT